MSVNIKMNYLYDVYLAY